MAASIQSVSDCMVMNSTLEIVVQFEHTVLFSGTFQNKQSSAFETNLSLFLFCSLWNESHFYVT